MKKIFKILLLIFAATILLYISGSVAAASFKIFEWHEALRSIVALIWFFACGATIILQYDET